MAYTFEVVKVEDDGKGGLIYSSVGYMMALFKTKKDACSYYNRRNQHMKPMTCHDGIYFSDWDRNTGLMYIVRKKFGPLKCTYTPFEWEDCPDTMIDGVPVYKFLK